MAEVEVTEYETVERTETRWECDGCDSIIEDDSDLYKSITWPAGKEAEDPIDLCGACADADEHAQMTDSLDRMRGLTELSINLANWFVGLTMITAGVFVGVVLVSSTNLLLAILASVLVAIPTAGLAIILIPITTMVLMRTIPKQYQNVGEHSDGPMEMEMEVSKEQAEDLIR